MALAKILHGYSDVKPDLKGGWQWTPDRQYPPLAAILKCKLWSSDIYAPHRDMLLRAAPSPTLEEGGTFITLRVNSDRSGDVPVTEVMPPVQHLC